MFNHVSVGTNDLERAIAFYDACLIPIGYRRTFTEAFGAAWGVQFPTFWVNLPFDQNLATVGNGTHVAIIAASEADVRRFYEAALENGGTDDGKPGLRDYFDGYYAAFVRDPDGNKIEAVYIPIVPFPTL